MGFSEPIELKQPVIYTRSNPNHGFTLILQLLDQIFYSPVNHVIYVMLVQRIKYWIN